MEFVTGSMTEQLIEYSMFPSVDAAIYYLQRDADKARPDFESAILSRIMTNAISAAARLPDVGDIAKRGAASAPRHPVRKKQKKSNCDDKSTSDENGATETKGATGTSGKTKEKVTDQNTETSENNTKEKGQKQHAPILQSEQQRWNRMYERYRAYKEEHGKVLVEPSKDPELYEWLEQVKQVYRAERDKAFSRYYRKLLRDLGFTLQFVDWENRFNEAKEFAQFYGRVSVPVKTHLRLAKWFDRQIKEVENKEKGERTKVLDEQFELLEKHLGNVRDFQPNFPNEPSGWEKYIQRRKQEFHDDFGKYWPILVQYKKQHGNCNVPSKYAQDLEFGKFCFKCRYMYERLRNGKTSHLTPLHIQKLLELGFVFRQKGAEHGKILSFKERLEQLKKFKDQHGHVDVTKENDFGGLRGWISARRSDYRMLRQGRSSSTRTEEQAKILMDLGVDLDPTGSAELPYQPKITVDTPWDVRFEQLKDYYRENGHTFVPLSMQGLGPWVRKQRSYMKRYLKKEKSPMNPERASKLSSIGFVADATCKRGNRREE